MKIGLMDSGIGGLTVLHCAQKMIPYADFIYYADEEHVPYGEKTTEELKGYLREIFHFFLEQQVDAIVIACNTATSVVSKDFREQFPIPIIGMEPAVKKAVDCFGDENKRILVAATPITIRGKKLHELVELVDKNHEVDLISLPKLVHFAEDGDFVSDKVTEYLREELKNYDVDAFGTIVLGCTHFSYFKECFQKILGTNVHLIDGNEGTIRQLMRVLHLSGQEVTQQTGKVTYLFSGAEVKPEDSAILSSCLSQLQREEYHD